MDQNKKAGGVLHAWLRLCMLALTFWIGSSVAQSPAGVYYVHTDHLNTPRAITNQVGQTVWSWENTDAFGADTPNENPGGLGTFSCNMRLPGQYFDKETGLHYNYFRDYDPATGRYIQSDPIGLRGGINTYAYTNDPLTLIDPYGLMGNAPGTFGKPGVSGSTPRPSTPDFPATISLGLGAVGMVGVQGSALEIGFATNFRKLCGYFQECQINGLGLCIGVGPQVGVQRGDVSTGSQQQAGGVIVGGRGMAADIQITRDPQGNVGGVKGIPVGVGYGAGGGYLECKTIYKCYP
jgi:RHS repeat-associated protein